MQLSSSGYPDGDSMPPRVLLVQSTDRISFTVIGELLDPLDVEIATTVDQVHHSVREAECDVLLVDQELDDGSSTDLLRQIREKRVLLPVVAWADDHARTEQLLDAGANLFVDPSCPQRVKQCIASARPLPPFGSVKKPHVRRVAELLVTGIPLPENALTAVAIELRDILFGTRNAWGAFSAGIITHTELRNLVLERVFCELGAPQSPSLQRNVLIRDLEDELFPRIASGRGAG